MDTRGYKVGDRLLFIGPYEKKGQVCKIAGFEVPNTSHKLLANVVFDNDAKDYGFYFDETRFDFSWVDPLKKKKILGEGRKKPNGGIRLIRG